MASEDRNTKNRIEITVLNTALGKDGKLLDDITTGKSMYEWMLDVDKSNYIEIPLEDNLYDKEKRYDAKTKKVISVKGKKQVPNENKKSKDDDELAQ